MSTTENVNVGRLRLDLENFRTTSQQTEEEAVGAMILTRPDQFWALAASLLEDGYLPTENIIVLKSDGRNPSLTVKEGNRRVAALKLIQGLVDRRLLPVPDNIERAITALSDEWLNANREVPCGVYEPSESELVDKVVTLAHAKSQYASRDPWNAVARARHSKMKLGSTKEHPLELLEKYLQTTRDLTQSKAQQWSGNYPLTVLEEAIKKLAPRLGFKTAKDLVDAYPSIPKREKFDKVILDIGEGDLTFTKMRVKDKDKEFGAAYGMPLAAPNSEAGDGSKAKDAETRPDGSAAAGTGSGKKGAESKAGSTGDTATSTKDPKTVVRTLKAFVPVGSESGKVVDLRDEAAFLASKLDLAPHAFCFVLRSMFEISAKAYCANHSKAGIATSKPDGRDRPLVELLKEIHGHLITKPDGKKDTAVQRRLHGALAELTGHDGILSVTSMNQLVHNPHFSVTPSEISIHFDRVFPLLEAMNG